MPNTFNTPSKHVSTNRTQRQNVKAMGGGTPPGKNVDKPSGGTTSSSVLAKKLARSTQLPTKSR